MKKHGSLKIILAILVIVLVCLISLGGIYVKEKNYMKNLLPEYKLGMDLDTNTIVKLDVKKEDSEKIDETAEEAENTEEAETEENSEETTENKENGQAEQKTYTEKDYKNAKKILEERMDIAEIPQYTIRLDESTGTVVIEVPEDTNTGILQNLFAVGKTEIKIKETQEVISTHEGIKKVTAEIDNTYENYYGSLVKLDIQFNNDAVKKFNEIKNNYVVPVNESGVEEENNIEILLDGTAICSLTETEFLNSTVNGTLSLVLGGYTTDKEALEETLLEANIMKNIMESGPLPITYDINYSNDIHSNVNMIGIVSVFAVILAIMFVYLLIRYKLKGILSGLTILGYISLVLLVIRYANVRISISALVSIVIIMILQFVYLARLLSKKVDSKTFTEQTIEFVKIIIPAFILSIIMAFANIIEISGFGMTMFWGIILFVIYNNIITRAILTNVKTKNK